MNENNSRRDSLEDWIECATIAMVEASKEARRLADETGTEFVARPAKKATSYKSDPKESLVVREESEE